MVFHPLTKMAKTALAASLLLAGSAVYAAAFTETQISPPPGQAAQGVPQQSLNAEPADTPDPLSLAPGAGGSEETELTIPGLGPIGKLPKLDFGLELLYGDGGEGPENRIDNRQDDVLIKGKIRHRF